MGLLLVTLGCSSAEDEPRGPELPAGWAGASRITDFRQSTCGGSALEPHDERIDVTVGRGALLVVYSDAHFRCEQEVEGFVRGSAGSLDLLVQPVDMHPASVAACDCLYEITLALESLPPGDHAVTLYRRWDALNQPNDPVEIQTVLSAVP
ncbi:MAG: hypothetical protein FJ104_00535 [Deltaproteobacteria bacterium]|nr:hypothetical protein [Deltaproteobacteria bacterium]